MNPDASLRTFLASHCRAFAPARYLEIGTREGDSLRVVVENSHGIARIVCCDTWGGEWGGTGRGGHAHIDAMLATMLYDGEAMYLDGDSKQTVPTLDEQFDLVLVDGDHSAEGGRADLDNVLPLVAKGGCVVFHDITHPAHPYLLEVWQRWCDDHEELIGATQVITEGHGLGIAIRS